jgi:diguanylate cyclase (GGDEF)-like protein
VQQVTHQDERASEAELVERVDDGETVLRRVQKKYVRRDGEVVWVSVTSTVVQDESGLPWYLISQYMDVTEARRRELQLDAEVRTDVLTGLGNRLALEDRLTRLSPDRRTALLFCDLDGYKAVNDAYGHLVGDGTLVAIGHRLLAAVREEDLVVRLGGDEFVVVSDGLGCRTLAEMAERIRVSIARPIDIRGVPVSITVSIGVASARAGDTADSVIDRADALMYQVKTAGKDGFRLAEDIWDELVV